MSFLDINGKNFLVVGVANRKSVAFSVAQLLESEGAKVFYSVRSKKRKDELQKILKDKSIFICDFEYEDQIQKEREPLQELKVFLHER